MIKKTKDVTGNQTLHKAQIDEKLALKEQLLVTEKQKKELEQKKRNKEVLPDSLQSSIKEQLEKKKQQRRVSMWAGTNVSQ